MLGATQFVVLMFAIACAVGETTAFQQSSDAQVNHMGHGNSDHANPYITSPVLADDIKNTLSIISSVETLPSCNRLAASALISECATLESSIASTSGHVGPDMMLDASKQVYAARLAVCELHDAKVHVPPACRSFLPTQKTTKQRILRWRMGGRTSPPQESYPYYEDFTRNDLDKCLSALHEHGSGQGWTSFSNSKKHAVAMCHAVRSDIEKDSHIHLFKVLANSTVGITEALCRSNEEWHELLTNFEELKSNMRHFHVQLNREHLSKQNEVVALWDGIKGQIARDLGAIADRVQSVEQQILHTGSLAEESGVKIADTFKGAHARLGDLAKQSNAILTATSDHSITLRDTVGWIQELVQHNLAKVLYEATQNVEQTNAVATANSDVLAQIFAHSQRASEMVAAVEATAVSLQNELHRMHLEATQDHERIQKINNQTMLHAEQANDSVLKMTAAVTSMTALLEFVQSKILAHMWDMFWLGLFLLLSIGIWRTCVQDALSRLALSFGTGIALTFILRLQDLLKSLPTPWIPLGYLAWGIPAFGLILIVVARSFYTTTAANRDGRRSGQPSLSRIELRQHVRDIQSRIRNDSKGHYRNGQPGDKVEEEWCERTSMTAVH